MKNVWKVEFEAKYTHVSDWLDEEVKVVANGDGLDVVRKATRKVIGRTFENSLGVKEGEEKFIICRCTKVRLTGLTLLHRIDD